MPCQLCGRWVVTGLPGQEWQDHGILRGPPNGPSWGAYYRSEDGRVWTVAHRECARSLRLFAYAPLLRAAVRTAWNCVEETVMQGRRLRKDLYHGRVVRGPDIQECFDQLEEELSRVRTQVQ